MNSRYPRRVLPLLRGQATSLALLIPLLLLFSYGSGTAAQDRRPFWIEKSSFVEGKDLFVVGVASHVKTVEEGRQKAFEQGKVELMNYAQVTDLEAQGLVIETQMTYEEPHADGTVSVFRLLRVPANKLLTIQGRIKAQGEAQEQALKQAQSELSAKQNELETLARNTERTLEEIRNLEKSLAKRAKQVEERQREVETLLSQLSGKPSGKGSLQSKLEEVEAQLDAREQEIAKVRQRAIDRIKQQNEQACKVVYGMTKEEIKAMIGPPFRTDEHGTWLYGTVAIHFNRFGLGFIAADQCSKK